MLEIRSEGLTVCLGHVDFDVIDESIRVVSLAVSKDRDLLLFEDPVETICLSAHVIRWRDVASAVWTASPEDLLWALSSFIPSAVYAEWLAARRKDDDRWWDEVRQVIGILRDDRLARLELETEASR